jgi:transposase InsO family protein
LVTPYVFFVIHHATRGAVRGRDDDAGVKVVRTSLHAPNMNSIAERFVLTVKTECLNKPILFGYHYREDRPHQALDNELITPRTEDEPTTGDVVVRERLGGLLRSDHRAA